MGGRRCAGVVPALHSKLPGGRASASDAGLDRGRAPIVLPCAGAARAAAASFPGGTSIDADLLRVPAGPGALHVERYGLGGHAIVLVHGFATSGFVWRAVAPPLALDGCTVLAVDLLGYGESDRPLEADYGIAAQAECLDRALAALRVDTATIVGLGIGGGVALRVAALRPARVAALVLVNSVAFEECPGRDVRAIQLGSARFALRLPRGLLGAAPLLRQVLEQSVADRGAMPARLVARYLAPYVGMDGVTHLLALARALRQEDVSELDLAAVRAPTTIVWGAADPWLDPGLPERLQSAIAHSTVVRLPGVGRLVPEESPDALVRIVREVVERTAPSAR